VSFERLADVIDTPQESNELDKAKVPLPSLQGDVSFRKPQLSIQQRLTTCSERRGFACESWDLRGNRGAER